MDHSGDNAARLKTAETRKSMTRAAMRAALLALLREMAFDQIRITDITLRAKVGYATFFRHYAAKEDLLTEIGAEEIASLLAMSIPVIERANSAESCRALCQYVFDRRDLWRTLLTGGAAASVRSEFVRQAREWSANFAGVVPTTVPRDLGTICAAGSTLDALAWWLDRTDEFSVEDIAGYIDRLIITPFVPLAGRG